MGRVSKRKATNSLTNQFESLYKVYKAGIYSRLSSDQDQKAFGKASKNESVEVQIEIAKKYVEEFNEKSKTEKIEIVEYYSDLGKTGTNFNRDEFSRLMQDIRLGDINCVIVKDFSRFGRNYIEAGNYIEKIFPFLGVRFIAVADGFDTGVKGNETKQMASEIKNLVNDMYAKDFSVKAKLHLKQRRQAGSYVGGPPPYGYEAVWEGKVRKLVPDENVCDIVRFIYERFVETESYAAVADELNRRKINPPVVYRKSKDAYYIEETADIPYKGWNKSAIERMLKSKTYMGTLVQGKTSITARNENNRIHKSEEEWIVNEDNHVGLISRELYEASRAVIGRIMEKSAEHSHPTAGYPLGENIFDSVLYCGVCGRKMTRDSHIKTYENGDKARLEGYFCLNGGQTKVDFCPDTNRISKTELVDILLPLFHMEFALYLSKPGKYLEIGDSIILEAKKKLAVRLREKDTEIRKQQEEESQIYMEYCAGKRKQKDYVSFKIKHVDRLMQLEKQKQDLLEEEKNLDKVSERYKKAIRSLLKLKKGKNLTKEMIEDFVEKIYVYPGKRIEVIFRYTNEMLEGVK